ncbi:hypothetical protein [Rhodocaloribacter sp.]
MTRFLSFRLLCAVCAVFTLATAGPARAGDDEKGGGKPGRAQAYTQADLRMTILYAGRTTQAAGPFRRASGRRSVPLAFALSAVLPGAGQVYNRQWVKALVGISVEAALITGYAVWRGQGLDEERAYQAFANAQWDPAKYASWLNDYQVFLNQQFNAGISTVDIAVPSGIDFTNPGSWSSADRQVVDAFFSQIRSVERRVFHPETGAAFSHQLPNFGDQQYYELIGKYFQFAPGWRDYPVWVDAEGNFTVAIDPEMTGPNGEKPNVSETFFAYAEDTAHANDLLRRASRLSLLFIVNHLVAGIDAAISSKLHNERIATSFGLTYNPNGAPQPAASIRFSF